MMLPRTEDEQLGKEAFARLVAAYDKKGKVVSATTPHPAERAQYARVAHIGARILDATGWRSEYRWEWNFVIVRDSAINAGMLPGGKMVVNTGMLAFATDDDELATVIGHEMAHAVARHGVERLSQEVVADTGLAILGAAASQTRYGPAIYVAAGLGAQFGVLLPYSRLHENEADFIGTLAMAKAGYDPAAALRFWQRMERESQTRPLEFFSTHPSRETRLAELTALQPYARRLRANPSLPLPKTRADLAKLK